jgi:Uncharacterized conserved protein
MIRFYYDKENGGKLVRDKMPEIIISEKRKVKVRQIEAKSLAGAILGKIPEELEELKIELETGNVDNEKTEIADLMTLLESYILARGFDYDEIKQIMDAKSAKRGIFAKGKVIEYIELNSNSEKYDFWLKYFRDNPDRYTEEKIDSAIARAEKGDMNA